MANCNFTPTITIGFQMIVQPVNSTNVHKLYTDRGIGNRSTAIVDVENSGTYRVSILPITSDSGILDSIVEFSEYIILSTDDATTNANIPGI